MLNGHLVEQVGRDQETISLIKERAHQPEYLAVMRHILAGTVETFEETFRTLKEVSGDDFYRDCMAFQVQEADRSAAAGHVERRPNGLLRAVCQEVDSYGLDRTFTTRDLVCAVEKRGFSFVSRVPRQSVYFALRSLEKAGRVEIVIRGHGRLMNIYRAIEGPQSVLYMEEVLHAG
jgi:hypothetical protein